MWDNVPSRYYEEARTLERAGACLVCTGFFGTASSVGHDLIYRLQIGAWPDIRNACMWDMFGLARPFVAWQGAQRIVDGCLNAPLWTFPLVLAFVGGWLVMLSEHLRRRKQTA